MSLLILFMALAGAPSDTPPTVPAPSPFSSAAPLDAGQLDRATAREDLSQIATSNQTARVSENSINGPSETGAIRFQDNAFNNMSGLAIINTNSGNNVAINATLNVNLSFAPAP